PSPRPPRAHLFPYTTLFRSDQPANGRRRRLRHRRLSRRVGIPHIDQAQAGVLPLTVQPARRSLSALRREDRAAAEDAEVVVVMRSEEHTLNSSHEWISYAVF